MHLIQHGCYFVLFQHPLITMTLIDRGPCSTYYLKGPWNKQYIQLSVFLKFPLAWSIAVSERLKTLVSL